MKTLNKSKLNKKALLAALTKRLGEKGASKSELQVLTSRFDDLMVALKNHYATSLVTKVDHNVIVDNLSEELAKTRDFKVVNFADLKFPDFPTKMEVNMVKPEWYEAPRKSVEVEGTVKVDNTEQSGMILTAIAGTFAALLDFLNKWKKTPFLVVKPDSEYLKPQLVILHDPYSGKALDINAVMKNAGGSASVSITGGGSGGNQVILDSLTQYHVNDADEASATKYYGFSDKDGNWYITKNDTAANSYRYTKGSGAYSTAWTNRAALTYALYDVTF